MKTPMTLLASTLGAALLLGVTQVALGQNSQAWIVCEAASAGPDVLIGACTEVIDSPSESDERRSDALASRSGAYSEINNHKKAIDDIERAIVLNPKNMELNFSHAITYSIRGFENAKMKNYSSAADDFDRVFELTPTDAYGWHFSCQNRAKTDQMQEALKVCNRAVTYAGRDLLIERNDGTVSRDTGSRANRGFVYLRLNRFEEALAEYSAILTLNPKHARALYGRGLVRLKMNDAKRGKADMAAAKVLEPKIEQFFFE